MVVEYPGAIAEFNVAPGSVALGATVTAANSGFSAMQVSAPSTAVYAEGLDGNSLAMLVTGSGATGQARWDVVKVGSRTFIHIVTHLRFTTQPTGYTPIIDVKQTDGGNIAFRISRGPTGLVRLSKSDLTAGANVAGTSMTAPTGSELAINAWNRLEAYVDVTSREYLIRWYLAASRVPLGQLSGVATPRNDGGAAFGASIAQVLFGRTASPDHTTYYGVTAIGAQPMGVRASVAKATTQNALRGSTPLILKKGNVFITALRGRGSINPGPTPPVDSLYREGYGTPVWTDDFNDRDSNGDYIVNPAKWGIWDRNVLANGTMPSTLGTLNDGGVVQGGMTTVVETDDGDTAMNIHTEWMSSPVITDNGPLNDDDPALDNPTYRWMRTGYADQRYINGANRQRYGRWEWRLRIPNKVDASLGMLWALWFRNSLTGEWDVSETWGSGPAAAGRVAPGPGVLYPRAAQPKPNAMSSTSTIHRNTSGGNTRVAYTHPHTTPLFGRDVGLIAEWTPDVYRITYDGKVLTELSPGDAASKFPLASQAIDGGVQKDLWTAPELQSPWYMRFNVHPGPSKTSYGMPDPAHKDWTVASDFQLKHAYVWAYSA